MCTVFEIVDCSNVIGSGSEKIEGTGYVEMLSRFARKGEFFSRTLNEGGAMGKLVGSSDWRDLELPFYGQPGSLPDRLTIPLVLPVPGTV